MITAQEVKKLRDLTGVGMMECKKALEESAGDVKRAIEVLRESGLKMAGKKCGRSASEGYIGSYIHNNGKVGVLVEVNCETDFVAKSEEFRNLSHDLAMHIAASNPKYVAYSDVESEVVENKKKEFMKEIEKEGKPQEIVEKIIEGKTKKYFDEVCLLSQPFVKDPEKTVEELVTEKVAKLGENIKVKRFVRFEI
jgi:elongation factor Ts